MSHPLRIIYAAGAGDVIRTYRHWIKGQDDPTQLAMTYSGMFYEHCRQGGHDAYVISSCGREDQVRDEHFRIVHRTTPFAHGPGPLFYIGQTWAGLRLIASAIWFRADVAVVACGTVSWIMLRIMPLIGIPVIPSLHCVLWPPHRTLTPLQRLLRRLRVPFFSRSAFRILSISAAVTEQLKEMSANRNRPILPFNPTYRRRQFQGIRPPSRQGPFHVLFAGRLERNKGAFDLLAIARRFALAGHTDVVFDVCGEGPASEELARQAAEASLADRFRCHGRCNCGRMRQMYTQASVVIVPTTGEFVEGFNKVVVEAVLAGRPVITSDACPALAYVGNAVVVVPVDDVQAYGDAILKLRDDAAFYQSKVDACPVVQEQFYDLKRSWMAALTEAIDAVSALLPADAPADEAALGSIH